MPRQGLVVTRVLSPRLVQEDRVRLALLTAIQRVAADVKRLFQQTVETWDHDVKFTISKRLSRSVARSGGDYGFTVETDDLIWGWLNEGTSVRYVVMSENFTAKTEVGSFQSQEGEGGPTGEFGNMPGIEARQWSFMATRQFEPVLQQVVARAIAQGLRDQLLSGRGR